MGAVGRRGRGPQGGLGRRGQEGALWEFGRGGRSGWGEGGALGACWVQRALWRAAPRTRIGQRACQKNQRGPRSGCHPARGGPGGWVTLVEIKAAFCLCSKMTSRMLNSLSPVHSVWPLPVLGSSSVPCLCPPLPLYQSSCLYLMLGLYLSCLSVSVSLYLYLFFL